MAEREQTSVAPTTTAAKAARVDLADFTETVTTGVLRALDARRIAGGDIGVSDRWRPWIWAGWIIGDGGPFGQGGPGGPLGPGGGAPFGPGAGGPGR